MFEKCPQSKWEDFKDFIKYNVWDRTETLYFDTINGIKNIYHWLPVIWKDRNWDSYYIYKVLRFKINRMADIIGENDRHLNTHKDVKRMRICVELLDRLIKDEYYEMHQKQHNEKWGNVHMISEEGSRPDLYSVVFWRPNANTLELREQENREFRINMKKAEYSRKNDREYLFKIMSKYVDGWWD